MSALRSIGRRALACVFLVACGDVYADPDDVVVPTPISPSPTDSNLTGTVVTSCPVMRPRENSLCGVAGSVCEYGSSPDRNCNEVLACNSILGGSIWEARPGQRCAPKACTGGSDIASLDGKTCTVTGATSDADETMCNMTDGVCACTTGAGGNDLHERRWVCVRPGSVSCPTSRPLAGQPCSGGLYCDYGSCSFKRGLVMECKGNVWTTGGAPCNR